MILDTFYLLFKSDSKDASKGIDELDKKITSLGQKGKKRSEEENKEYQQAIKQRKELNESLKETQSQYEKIGDNIVQAATAAFTFGSITKGFLDTANVNSNLQIQAKLLGQNTSELKAYDAAAEAAGAQSGEFASYLQNTFHDLALQGGELPTIPEFVRKVREGLKGIISPKDRERYFAGLGITSPGVKAFFSENNEQFEKSIRLLSELNKNTEKGAEVARQWKESWSNTSSALSSVYTTVGIQLLPTFEKLNENITKFLGKISDDSPEAKKNIENITHAVELLAEAIAIKLIPKIIRIGIVSAGALAEFAPLLGAALVVDRIVRGKESFVGKATGQIIDKLSPAVKYLSHGEESPVDRKRKESLIKKDSYKTFSEPLPNTPEWIDQWKALNNGTNPYAAKAKTSLGIAGNSTIGLGSTLNTDTNNSRTISLKTGDIHIHTNASDVSGIAGSLSDELGRHFSNAMFNMEDGIAR